jgi:outer membrane protein OmpA-like peptidoglycan-associated protein
MHRSAAIAVLVCLIAVVGAHAGPADDRLVLSAPNTLGNNGLVRVTSALIDDTGTMQLGLSGRFFSATDFVVPDVVDATTLLDGNAVVGLSLFRALELTLQSHAGATLNTARSQPQASVGDLAVGLKGGFSAGFVAAAASVRLGLPTRANKVGFELGNSALTGAGHLTFDLLEVGVPVRAHLNGGYTFQAGKLAGADPAKNPFFLDGVDGSLVALASQQWFFDQVHAGLGVEALLPYVTPFVEVWYQSAIGAPGGYAFVGDAWLTLTPGVRFGLGGLRVDLAADVGLSGTAGGVVVDIANVAAGQPINPAWAARIALAHSFDVVGGVVGAGGGSFARLEGCATEGGQPVVGATAVVAVDGQPGPRLLADAAGCFGAPVQAGTLTVVVGAPDHADVTVSVKVAAGDVARADAVLVAARRQGRVMGFVTNKDDESIEGSLLVTDVSGTRDAGRSVAGAFELDIAAGRAAIVASADGYLRQGARITIDADDRRTVTFVMRKEPKKRSATLTAAKIDLAGRLPFVFKSQRLQSTAGYLLDEIADLLHANPQVRVSIEVHTDSTEVSDPSAAKALTEGRADVVKDALSDLGIDPARLETAGYGIKQLVGPPNDPRNRRVELLVIPD